ncbi:GNAT family N-acetyltransferase [Microaceticoccus formicicus]|uniref:GNAT family N-acetyltransferase n=1 Tax=Microaceticoccus formicicus TaxID=3118105 RepID=UPI003CD01465|nr:GNAT family N-acetyltransferase [Peptoniphilaceae bacterium AMB_02]
MDIVRDNERFYVGEKQNPDAFLSFKNKDGILYVNSTFVDASLRGQGVAAKLVMELINYAVENEFKIKPICSYVVKYFEKNKEYSELLA